MNTKGLINSIVYTDFHDKLGPNPLFWHPSDLSENVRMLVSIKSVTLLSGSHGYVPDSLSIIPFPSIKLKGLIKFIEREDDSRRGGFAQSAITFLFKEADDIIFYKYINSLNSLFSETAQKIIDLEKSNSDNIKIYEEVRNLREDVCNLLGELRRKEFMISETEPFPEEKIEGKLIDFKFKLAVCGDPGVGKTSTILRFTDNAFRRTYIPTMGINVTDKSFRVEGSVVELILWDVAGQAKFSSVRKHFYQGAEAIILIFDLTNPQSFESIADWFKDIRKNLPNKPNLLGYIFGNKLDLDYKRKIKGFDARSLAKELNLKYIEISALTGQNIENAFYNIAKSLIELRKIPPMNN